MIVLDTSILSTFALINQLDLLFALFPKDEAGIPSAVYAELVVGVREGRQFLNSAVELMEKGRLKLWALTAEEVVRRLDLPESLGDGEAESIVLCQSRGAAFVTNDRRARNFCLAEGVEVFDLLDLLRSFWKLGVCSRREVHQMVAGIEAKEGLVIKHKERVFAR